MSVETMKWLLEIILAVIVGYFAAWFAVLTVVSIEDVFRIFSETNSIDSAASPIYRSLAYFIGFVITGYIALMAFNAAGRGGEWKWR